MRPGSEMLLVVAHAGGFLKTGGVYLTAVTRFEKNKRGEIRRGVDDEIVNKVGVCECGKCEGAC
eukprot:GDKH01003348.1.p3 GENE.GDKH01003348.1~~GDKH01003348.1.p3  ORF type:complete len:64 (-),score=0.20 GDKH01003348.1:61-252(-)